MTTKEMIEVMQAYADGKTIESKHIDEDEELWKKISVPCWNWCYYVYRVKAEAKYRPYQNKDELLDDLAYKGNNYHIIWFKSKIDGSLAMITEYNNVGIRISGILGEYQTVFENYTFEDGTPFGIKEK